MNGPEQEAWRARVLGVDGGICGAGVLFDRWRVLTCAHVVAKALRADPSGPQPSGVVTVNFPTLAGVTRLGAVMTGGWVPMAADGRGDLAVLVLDQAAPAEVHPAPLGQCGELDGRQVRAYGHPGRLDDGVWAETRLVGSGGPGGEWVQMDGLAVTGHRVERGFSGAGVFDDRSATVVGVVVAEDRQAANRVAWMLPMERVRAYLPVIAPIDDRRPDRQVPARRQPGGAPERRLSGAEHGELVERLLAVPRMRDRSARDLYLRAVRQELADSLTFERQEDPRLDLWAWSYALLERPGSLRVVAGVLVQMHADSPEVLALEEFVERHFPDLLLDHRERLEVETLLEVAEPGWVGPAHHRALAVVTPVPVALPDLRSVLRHLEGFGRLRGGPPPPLLVFVDDLAHRIGGGTSIRLHRWIDGVGERLRVDRAGLGQLCVETDRRHTASTQVYVVVALKPERVGADRYLMSVWSQEGRDERLLLRDDVPRTLTEVSAKLDELLPVVADQTLGDFEELVVEFVLPRRLIGYPFDQWESDRDGFPRPLGIRHPVTVRSLDRLAKRDEHGVWRRKWRRLTEGPRDGAAPVSYVESGRSQDPRALYSALVGDDGLVCLAVPFPPADTDDDAARRDEFGAGLSAGMPVIVWSREPVDGARFRALVRDRLTDRGVLNLPQRALSFRRETLHAIVDQHSPGLPPVGVLWDDPERIPPPFRRQDVRLQAPS